MEKKLLFVLAACAAIVLPANAEDAATHRVAEQLRYFSASAARRGLADLKANPKYDYGKWAPKVEALIAAEGDVRAVLKAEAAPGLVPPAPTGRKLSTDEAVALVAGYRAAMLANPILDFDRILCVRRKIKNPRSAFGGRASGMTGLNAENHMVAPRRGFENEIVVLSN